MKFLRFLNFLPFVAPNPSSTPSRTDVCRVLDGAADEIGKCGWVQGLYQDLNGGLCASMAISRAAEKVAMDIGNPMADYGLAREARLQLMKQVPGHYPHVPSWNDQWGRSKREVIDTLRKAAETAN